MNNGKDTPLTRRGGKNQVIGASGKPLLVIIEGEDINEMVEAGLEAIGGIGRILDDSKKVLLKPNTNQRDPFPSITAPETLRAVASHLRDAGVKEIIVHEDHKFELEPYYQDEDIPGADVVAMDLVKRYDRTFDSDNEAIVRRQHEHAEELGLGTGDLSAFEIIEKGI